MKKHVLFLCLLLLCACQQNEEESLLQERQTDSRFKYVTDSDPLPKEEYGNQQIASRLAKTAVEIPDVKDATAVVLGNYAAVGIDVDKDLDRARVGVIKYSVAEALQHDPYGRNAIIIADADGLERLKGIGQKISEGHPIDGITEELTQIVARYMPEGPINDRPQSETNQESIPNRDQQELDRIEKQQSKDQ